MKTTVIFSIAASMLSLASCTMPTTPKSAAVITAPAERPSQRPADWRAVATQDDRTRIRNWRDAWMAALAETRTMEDGRMIAVDADLFDPDAALPNPYLPPGEYRCRTIKLGSRGDSNLTYVSYDWFRCRVTAEQDMFSLAKVSGSQRPIGLLFDDTDRRQIFLGTLQLGDERGVYDYGTDRERDMAGVIERIGSERWRLVLPYPAFESLLDIIELRPADAS